jgi:hypothetical protein
MEAEAALAKKKTANKSRKNRRHFLNSRKYKTTGLVILALTLIFLFQNCVGGKTLFSVLSMQTKAHAYCDPGDGSCVVGDDPCRTECWERGFTYCYIRPPSAVTCGNSSPSSEPIPAPAPPEEGGSNTGPIPPPNKIIYMDVNKCMHKDIFDAIYATAVKKLQNDSCNTAASNLPGTAPRVYTRFNEVGALGRLQQLMAAGRINIESQDPLCNLTPQGGRAAAFYRASTDTIEICPSFFGTMKVNPDGSVQSITLTDISAGILIHEVRHALGHWHSTPAPGDEYFRFDNAVNTSCGTDIRSHGYVKFTGCGSSAAIPTFGVTSGAMFALLMTPYRAEAQTYSNASDEEYDLIYNPTYCAGVVDYDPATAPTPTTTYSSEYACESANPGWECDPVIVDGATRYFKSRLVSPTGSTPSPTPVPVSSQDGATFVSQSVPTNMIAGRAYNVSVTMKNSGTTTWTQGSQFFLGAQGPQDNGIWSASARVALAAGETVAPGANKTFSFTVNAPSIAANYNFQWRMVHEFVRWFGEVTPYTNIQVQNSAGVADFDGDKKTDLIVWRSSNGYWHAANSSSGYVTTDSRPFGGPGLGDIPLIGDFDGDGRIDYIIWRASTGYWFWLTSSSSYTSSGVRQFGSQSVGDIPLVGDIDGDGRDDIAVWRPTTGTFFWLTSSSGFTAGNSIQWGSQSLGDIPKLADMDGDGKADFVVWRGPTGFWYWLPSTNNYMYGISKQFGSQSVGDIPLLGDMDGDSKSEIIVWRPGTGTWFWLHSSTGYTIGDSRQWGSGSVGDIPKVSDFDGDRKVDLTVWRPGTGTWFWLNSSGGYTGASAGSKQWGSALHGDIPLAR